jgi:hypothetical protein
VENLNTANHATPVSRTNPVNNGVNYRLDMKDRDGNTMVNLKHLGVGMIIAGLFMGGAAISESFAKAIGGFFLMVINGFRGGD